MLNDVIFNDEKSAYDEWNIVLTKADIPLPEPKTSLVEIKGADGLLDLSEVLTGDICYNNDSLSLNTLRLIYRCSTDIIIIFIIS